MRLKGISILSLLLFIFFSYSVSAQTNYMMSPDPQFTVSGTSTLSDWEMVSSTGSGTLVATVDGRTITEVSQARVTMSAESLESGKRGMDRNTYKALKSDRHPNITFVMTVLRDLRHVGDVAHMTVLGDLTAAGTTRSVEMTVIGRADGRRLYFEGSTRILLTHFNIDPPTAVLGTIRTGDEVTLAFKAHFQSN
jgi:polyisoprenoid-binding protein YceI